MNETFLMQLVGTGFGTAIGGFAAWTAIKVDVALAKQAAENAHASAKEAHERMDEHVEFHHTNRRNCV